VGGELLVKQISQIAFGVLARARQFFCEVRLASRLPLWSAVEGWVWLDVRDVDAVRPTRASLEEAASRAKGFRQVFRYVAQASAVRVDVTVFCHDEGGVSNANWWWM